MGATTIKIIQLIYKIITILDRTIAQNEAHKKFSDVFAADEGFKKYLV